MPVTDTPEGDPSRPVPGPGAEAETRAATGGAERRGPLANLFGRRLAPGTLVAGCRVERELGRGANGVVYAGAGPGGQPVAIKALLALEPSPERLARLRREAEVAQGLDHPGIVRVLGHDAAGAVPCVVLELVAGRELGRVLEEDDPPLEVRLELLEQVARAVAHAHERRVIHRDLKPANVLVDRDGRCKVTDFGLARELDRETRLSLSGQELGTPAYMAPEQVLGRKDVGPPADVHALGVMLFEAVTGRLPWPASTPLALLDLIVKSPPPPLSSLAAGLPRDLEGLVQRAMAKDAAARPTAAALARDLAIVRNGGLLARRREPPGLALALAALVALAVALAVAVGVALGRRDAATGAGASSIASGVPSRPVVSRPDDHRPVASPPDDPRPIASQAPASQPLAAQPTPPPADGLAGARVALREGRLDEAAAPLTADTSEAARALAAEVSACRRALAEGEAALLVVESHDRAPPEVELAIRDAVAAARRARELAPASPSALWLAARAHDAGLDLDAAEGALDELLRRPALEPALAVPAWRLRALVAAGRDDAPGAEAALDAVVRLAPEDPWPHALRGAWYALNDGDAGKAIGHLKKAEELAPQGYDGLLAKALRLTLLLGAAAPERRAELHIAPAAAAKKAHELAPPDDHRARDLEGRAYALGGQERLRDAALRLALANHERRVGRLGFALRTLRNARLAITREPDPARRAGLKPHLVRIFRRIQAERPGHPLALTELAIGVHRVTGVVARADARFTGFVARYRLAIEANAAHWEAHLNLGLLIRDGSRERADREEALVELDLAARLGGREASTHLERGRCLLLLERSELAEADARHVTNLAPDLEAGWELLDAALRAQGKPGQADAAGRPRQRQEQPGR